MSCEMSRREVDFNWFISSDRTFSVVNSVVDTL